MKLQQKLISSFLLVALLPLLFISVNLYFSFKSLLIANEKNKITSINTNKKEAFKLLLENLEETAEATSRDGILLESFDQLKAYHDKVSPDPAGEFPVNSEEYQAIWKEVNQRLHHYIKDHALYDLMIICKAHGHVIYTHAKEPDLGQNVSVGTLKDSGLGHAWSGALKTDDYFFEDFSKYAPSNGLPGAFAAHVVKKGSDTMAVVVMQISEKNINSLMFKREGMGRTAESYLVGQDGLMRSDSFLNPEKYSLNNSFAQNNKISSATYQDAMRGEVGVDTIINDKGNLVISGHDFIDIASSGVRYAILTEIDMDEVLEAIFALRNKIILVCLVIIAAIAVGGFYFARSIKFFTDHLIASADNVVNSSNQVSSGNQDLSSRTQEQASMLQATAATVEEITSQIKQTAENSQKATELSSATVTKASEGASISNETKEAMSEISSSSQKISDIIGLVENIAFQTNILAINAAIEAAKAGEQGKGFAVVAIEVRDLAQRASDATKEIKLLIKNSVEKVQKGEKLVLRSNEKLQEISQEVKEVTGLMQEVSTATKEQFSAVEQINNSITQLDSTTQQNAALVEQIAAASENMATTGKGTHKLIQEYVLGKKAA
ncbi:MAG: hypothetical protein HQK50_11875 [Oligoflexia bacterium]|nr:hypothetical protein [Oligoflexia bacterium]